MGFKLKHGLQEDKYKLCMESMQSVMIYELIHKRLMWKEQWLVPESVLCASAAHERRGYPWGLSSLQLGQAGHPPSHRPSLLPTQPLLSYLMYTSVSSPKAPFSTAFSKAIMVFSGPSCGRKGHQTIYLRVSPPSTPLIAGREPGGKRASGSSVWLP